MSITIVKTAITTQLAAQMVYPTGLAPLQMYPLADIYVAGSLPALIVSRAPSPYKATTRYATRGDMWRSYTVQLTILAGNSAGDIPSLQTATELYCEAILPAIAYDPTFGNICEYAGDDASTQLEDDYIGPIEWGAGQYYFGALMYLGINETINYTPKP